MFSPSLPSFMQTTPGHDYVDPDHLAVAGIGTVAVCMNGEAVKQNQSSAHNGPERLTPADHPQTCPLRPRNYGLGAWTHGS